MLIHLNTLESEKNSRLLDKVFVALQASRPGPILCVFRISRLWKIEWKRRIFYRLVKEFQKRLTSKRAKSHFCSFVRKKSGEGAIIASLIKKPDFRQKCAKNTGFSTFSNQYDFFKKCSSSFEIFYKKKFKLSLASPG